MRLVTFRVSLKSFVVLLVFRIEGGGTSHRPLLPSSVFHIPVSHTELGCFQRELSSAWIVIKFCFSKLSSSGSISGQFHCTDRPII